MNVQDFTASAMLDDAGFDVYEYRIVCRIARRGECWESLPSIARTTGIDVKKVRSVIHKLVENGVVCATIRRGASTIYTLNDPAFWVITPTLKGGTPLPQKGVPPTSNGSTPLPQTVVHPYLRREYTPTLEGSTPLPPEVGKVIPLSNPLSNPFKESENPLLFLELDETERDKRRLSAIENSSTVIEAYQNFLFAFNARSDRNGTNIHFQVREQIEQAVKDVGTWTVVLHGVYQLRDRNPFNVGALIEEYNRKTNQANGNKFSNNLGTRRDQFERGQFSNVAETSSADYSALGWD